MTGNIILYVMTGAAGLFCGILIGIMAADRYWWKKIDRDGYKRASEEIIYKPVFRAIQNDTENITKNNKKGELNKHEHESKQ